jgi:DNA-binding SARP family transcriptional activator
VARWQTPEADVTSQNGQSWGARWRAELKILNGFEIHTSAGALSVPRPAQRVIALLAVNERPLMRSYVAGVLWPTTTRDRSMANLRSALRGAAAGLVRRSQTQLGLGDNVTVDYRLSIGAANAVLAGRFSAGALGPTLELLGGELLPDFSDDWIEPFRLYRHQLRLNALEALADQLLAAEQPGLAVQAAMVAVIAEPLRESAHLRLIRALLAEGNRAQALRHYAQFRDSLLNELGVSPSFAFNDALAG